MSLLITGGLLGTPSQLLLGGLCPLGAADPFDVDLYAYLAGAGLGVPIYPGHVPEDAGTGPAISYLAVSEEPYFTLARAAGLTARVYQFSAWSTSFLAAAKVEKSLRAALNGFRGMMGSTFVSSCRLQQCLDLPYEADPASSDLGTYQRAAEYRIAFREPAPAF